MIDPHIKYFSERLSDWYDPDRRPLPWKNITNPYHIWISEVILQQTRVEQGKSYYFAFIQHFPDIQALAKSDIDLVLKIWEGLGYYSRAVMLHKGAQEVVNKFGGKLPSSYEELLTISSIGPYTAAAIASFAFHQKIPAIDGNVNRIIARYFGIDIPVDSAQGKKEISQAAQSVIWHHNPAAFNQAMMDFGALVCKPLPQCTDCVMNEQCFAYQNNSVSILPVKKSKVAKKTIFWDYLLLIHENQIMVRKRPNNGLYKNMYDFILIQSPQFLNDKQACTNFSDIIGFKPMFDYRSIYNTQILTHRNIQYSFSIAHTENKLLINDYEWVTIASLSQKAFPAFIAQNLDNLLQYV